MDRLRSIRHRLATRFRVSFRVGNGRPDAVVAMRRLAGLASEAIDPDRLRRHAELLALGAGVGAAEAGMWGEAAILHLVGRAATGSASGSAAAELGRRLLAHSREPVLRLAAVMAAGMAERWDGAGFPDGLAGEAIPLAARVAAVALRFEEATRDAAGFPAGARTASAALSALSGTVLDPALVSELRISADGLGAPGNRRPELVPLRQPAPRMLAALSS